MLERYYTAHVLWSHSCQNRIHEVIIINPVIVNIVINICGTTGLGLFCMSYLTDPMARYKSRRSQQADPLTGFEVLGYIAAGTYGRVYKARERISQDDGLGTERPPDKDKTQRLPRIVAIKKFKSDNPNDVVQFTGLSQSAYRELALCRESSHPNSVGLVTTILYDKAIYLVFEYAEHDLSQLIQFHCSNNSSASSVAHSGSGGRSSDASAPGTAGSTSRMPSKLAPSLVKSVLYQICEGVAYLHENWVSHRDLKPANIMISAQGRVKIGDLGSARQFKEPLQSSYSGDKVVVTVWYRAPELSLGCRHYTTAIDMWAVGCIFAEMLSLRPIFKGEEVAMIPDKAGNNHGANGAAGGGTNFQRDQVDKVTKISGTPTPEMWPAITSTPEYQNLKAMRPYKWCSDEWHRHFDPQNPDTLVSLQRLSDYNPDTRVSAQDVLKSWPYFGDSSSIPSYKTNCFENQPVHYPSRRITTTDIDMSAPPPSKRNQSHQASERKKRRY